MSITNLHVWFACPDLNRFVCVLTAAQAAACSNGSSDMQANSRKCSLNSVCHQKQVRLPLILATSLLAGSHRCGPQSGDKFDFTLQQEANTTRLDDLIGSPQATADQLAHNMLVAQFLKPAEVYSRLMKKGWVL